MRTILIFGAAMLAAGGVARAQSPAGSGPNHGYVEGVVQSAFGNVTSQSFGGEVGFTVYPNLQVFVDGGVVRDAAPSTLGANAQIIASGVSALAGTTTYQVKEPVTFGVAGLKYSFDTGNPRIVPYLMAGGGAAQVKKDVTFTLPAGDISQYATLGSDLSGSETKGMLSIGLGVDVPLGSIVVVDLQYRYGRVFTSDGLNINRAGIGIGVRF